MLDSDRDAVLAILTGASPQIVKTFTPAFAPLLLVQTVTNTNLNLPAMTFVAAAYMGSG